LWVLLGGGCYQASTDQAQMDTIVPILSGGLLAIAFATSGILVVMVGVTWQLILIIIPLSWIYYSYQVSKHPTNKKSPFSSFLLASLGLTNLVGLLLICVFLGGRYFFYYPINYKLRINVTIQPSFILQMW
jgi:heme O synthase-like polyprenyltransferase